MELYDVMTTTFASRDFTDEPLPDETLFKILDHARFAPSGGNRQGWKVIVVRDKKTREGLSRAGEPAAKRYAAQIEVGETPWNTIERTRVDAATIERTPAPSSATEPVLKAAVVLVVGVDLRLAASMDADLDRVGVVSGVFLAGVAGLGPQGLALVLLGFGLASAVGTRLGGAAADSGARAGHDRHRSPCLHGHGRFSRAVRFDAQGTGRWRDAQ